MIEDKTIKKIKELIDSDADIKAIIFPVFNCFL